MRCIHCGSRARKARDKELTILMNALTLQVSYRILDISVIHSLVEKIFLYNGWEKIAGKLSNGGIKVKIVPMLL